jgi:hypothetical protein
MAIKENLRKVHFFCICFSYFRPSLLDCGVHSYSQSPNFKTFKEPRNRFQQDYVARWAGTTNRVPWNRFLDSLKV